MSCLVLSSVFLVLGLGDMMMKNIAIVGFMGTGKSAVAIALAERLGMSYVSTDDIVVLEEGGMSIHDIFKEKGEPTFREVEARAVKKVSEMTHVVIDCGGGVVLRDDNMKNLKRSGTVVCLIATPAVIYERVKGHRHRPLLNVADPQMAIKKVLTERAPFYARADYTVDTSGLSIEEVVERILKIFKK